VNRILCVALFVTALSGCGEPAPPATKDAPSAFRIDDSRLTVSGVSSGAYLATQLHVAYADRFAGAALIAGGPYACAQGNLTQALGPCMKGGDLEVDELLEHAAELAEDEEIAPLDSLQGDKVWLFRATGDEIMHADTTAAAADFYRALGVDVSVVDDVDAPHGLPTLDRGVECAVFESPYLNACSYDAAGELLASLYGPLDVADDTSGELVEIGIADASDASLLDKAYLFVPEACAAGEACGVHVALHGCLQSAELIGDTFARDAGFNRWAASNRLLVLYPQVAGSRIAPMNPNGCWDWWGYTGPDYDRRDGAQLVAIVNTIDSLSDAREAAGDR
jgi:hypothetical protein